ncbi:MAG: NAD-dependent epimerase/dehydratase family protein [archaeon]|nr:NAD-dependent epimerase/dehydratase family protein [archaeon]
MIKKVLLVGGAGFIGTNLRRSLLKLDYDVKIFDWRESDINPFSRNIIKNHPHLLSDIRWADTVFHLAAIPAHRLSVERCNEIIYNNCNVSMNIVEFCKILKKPLIYASSFSVYGKQPGPWTEDMQTYQDTPYSFSKVVSEDLIKLHHKLYGLKAIMARFSNVYGNFEELHEPCQVLPTWFEAAKKGETLTVYGEETTRDFTHVQDVVDALILLMNYETDFDIFNICRGEEVKLLDVAKAISDNVKVEPLPDYEASSWVGDHSKITEKLGWKPTRNVFDYIKEKKEEIQRGIEQ